MHADVRTSAVLCSLLALSQAFYIPGYSVKSYREGETIPLLVNKLYSEQSELQYAYSELPFVCPPTGRVKTGRFTSGASISLNLGEVLRGDRITVSDYELVMGKDEEVRFLCKRTVNEDGVNKAKDLIRNNYKAEWIVDNLPGATSFQSTDKTRKYYASGFKIGEEVAGKGKEETHYLLYNHVTIVIRYHSIREIDGDTSKKLIVGFEVFPKSIGPGDRTEEGIPRNISNVQEPMRLESPTGAGKKDGEAASLTIPYTYAVYFREDEKLEWQNRWDMYFVVQDESSNVHWMSILNSLVITGFLTAVVVVILARTVRGDIKGYEEGSLDGRAIRSKGSKSAKSHNGSLLDKLGDAEEADFSDDEIEDITGWKLVHGDVFRPPPHAALLAPLIGSGIQLLFVAIGLIILSAVGVLNPSFRGGYVSVGMGLFIFAGVFSGYFSARIYKTFGGQLWKNNILITAALVPGLLFSTVFIMNLFVWMQASSTAIPFGTLIALLCLWLFIQLPLVYLGGWYGYEQAGAWSHPIKPNAIPRQVPVQSWHNRGIQSLLLTGFIPFMVIFIELMFVFKSLWLDKTGYYYVFGFTGVVSVILGVTITQVTVVATYIQLCAENYHWWWQSFLVGGSSALWIYAYMLYYYFAKLRIAGFVSSILFFTYGFLACGAYALLTGTLGFLAAYVFVRKIYGAVKVD